MQSGSKTSGGSWYIAFSGLFGAIGVIAGAVGSHVLKARLPAADLEIFTTAVIYLLVHTTALFACGLALQSQPANRSYRLAGGFLIAGILLFCGGLIARSVTGSPLPGPIAPIGGSALIMGWLAIAVGGLCNVRQLR